MANTTASASGVNRYFATPVMKTTGTNTMQMQSVATKAGVAICCAPSRIALITGFPIARLRFVFSISTVASSTRIPTASASPPSVITLSVSPRSDSVITETRMASGIDTTITSVERHEPRKRRIMIPVSAAAMTASRRTPCSDARTNTDSAKSGLTSSGERRLDAGQGVLHALDDVEGRGGRGLQDRKHRREPAVDVDHVRLH